jgi:TolB-like protein/Tfp pilus assembly protein PilF
MFTDMVGYTALGQSNEPLSLALVKEQRKLVRPILARHDGKEIKTIGDALLVEFPSALDAVRCAYDIQRAIREFNLALSDERRIHLRIGIHLGDVVESDGDISGDAVNLASRVEPLAEDGGICLTRQVYDHVKGKFELRLWSLGPQQMKNVKEPVEIFRMELPWAEEKVRRAARLSRKRIAVLPFANISPSPDDEYFADGMTEELISSLSKIRDLGVTARTSTMRYKDPKKSAVEIGHELEVGYLMEGSVRKAGNRIRITVQLIDALTEEHIWSENYDRELQDVFAIQSEIAAHIGKALKVKLLGEVERPSEERARENVPAYLVYLKGRTLLNRRDAAGWIEARELFESAISQDPGFAPAFAGLAEAWYRLGANETVPMQLARSKVDEYVRKALSLDDHLPEAHVTLAIKHNDEYDWEGAEREFREAIELNPNLATAHRYYAVTLADMGRFGEAQEEIEIAERTDPLSADVIMSAIFMHCCLLQLDMALTKLEKVTRLDPKNPNLLTFRAFYNYRKGNYTEAAEWLEKRLAVSESHYLTGALGSLYVNIGKRDKAIEQRDKLLALPEDTIGRAGDIAFISGYLGEPDEFFKWALRGAEERALDLISYRIDPELQYIREDPRWIDLLNKCNLKS